MKGAQHDRDVLREKIGPGAAIRVGDTGERDINIRACEIVDLDHRIALDAFPGRVREPAASRPERVQQLLPGVRLAARIGLGLDFGDEPGPAHQDRLEALDRLSRQAEPHLDPPEQEEPLDRADRLAMRRSTQTALEKNRTGAASAWRNPDSGNEGTITPTRTYRTGQGQYCREYRQTITVGGKTE